MKRELHEIKFENDRKEAYLVSLIKDFKERNGDWPKAQDIPSIGRTIQRRFGGLPYFRKKHNLGYEDYTKGDYRAKATVAFNTKGQEEELKLYNLLIEKYGKVNVHREYLFIAGRKMRADFLIFKDGKEMMTIDCFFPKDTYSLKGCLNQKIKKYANYHSSKVVFIQLNTKIPKEVLNEVVLYRKTPLEENQYVVTIDEFISNGFVV